MSMLRFCLNGLYRYASLGTFLGCVWCLTTDGFSQSPPVELPPAESVIPLPAVPAPSGFQGFGDRKIDPREELPDPNLPPAYQFPPPKPPSSKPSDVPKSLPNPLPFPSTMEAGRLGRPWEDPVAFPQ